MFPEPCRKVTDIGISHPVCGFTYRAPPMGQILPCCFHAQGPEESIHSGSKFLTEA